MIKGVMNKYLHIDLSTREFHFETPAEGLFEEFLGGKGAGLKLMVDMGLITHDPLSPENPLVFFTGPFTGSRVQTSARSTLVTKSPLINTFLDSNIGRVNIPCSFFHNKPYSVFIFLQYVQCCVG